MEIKADVLTGVGLHRPIKANSRTPESKVLAAVKKWAHDKPDVYVVRVVEAGMNGTPDFILCVRGKFVGVECKATGEKLRPLQAKHGEYIQAAYGTFLWGDAETLIPQLDLLYCGATE